MPIFVSTTSRSNLVNSQLPFLPAVCQPDIWWKYQIVILQITITTSHADLSSVLNFRRRIYVSTWYPRTNIRANAFTNASFVRTSSVVSSRTLPRILRLIWLISTRISSRRELLWLVTFLGYMRLKMIPSWRRRKLVQVKKCKFLLTTIKQLFLFLLRLRCLSFIQWWHRW